MMEELRFLPAWLLHQVYTSDSIALNNTTLQSFTLVTGHIVDFTFGECSEIVGGDEDVRVSWVFHSMLLSLFFVLVDVLDMEAAPFRISNAAHMHQTLRQSNPNAIAHRTGYHEPFPNFCLPYADCMRLLWYDRGATIQLRSLDQTCAPRTSLSSWKRQS